MPPRLCRLAAANLALLVLAMLLPQGLQAVESSLIRASGTMDAGASVEVPTDQSSGTPQISRDGTFMKVANDEPVTLSSNVPSLVELSPLQLTVPSDVDPSSVAAIITLRRPNGELLVGTSTSGGDSEPFGVGQVEASVNVRFYSTTDQPLAAGTYTAATTLSIVAE